MIDGLFVASLSPSVSLLHWFSTKLTKTSCVSPAIVWNGGIPAQVYALARSALAIVPDMWQRNPALMRCGSASKAYCVGARQVGHSIIWGVSLTVFFMYRTNPRANRGNYRAVAMGLRMGLNQYGIQRERHGGVRSVHDFSGRLAEYY